MKQADLAVQISPDYSRSMVALVETGRRGLPFARVVNVARALGVSLDYLAGLTDDHRPAAEISRLLVECERATASPSLARSPPAIRHVCAGPPARRSPMSDRKSDDLPDQPTGMKEDVTRQEPTDPSRAV